MSVKSPDKVDGEVGLRIRVQRQAANLTQTALADQLGVTFQQVQKYEKGAMPLFCRIANSVARSKIEYL